MQKYQTLDHIELPSELSASWQQSVDLLAEALEVPAALVMRVHAKDIEVFVRSQNPENVYKPGEKANLDTGLYCETVMDTRQELQVPNALTDPAWGHNPDIELGMISYCGLPVAWPDGEIFGTICILDLKENKFSKMHRRLLEQFRNTVQAQLAEVHDHHLLKQANEDLERKIAERTEHLEQEVEEHIKTEDALLQAKNAAEEADQAKSKFLSSMSHELRTPLNSILGFAQVLEMNPKQPLSIEQKKCLDHIMGSGRHLLELVEEVLDLERIKSGNLNLSLENMGLNAICQDCLLLIEPQTTERALNVEVNVDAAITVTADDTRLKQVLFNLLTNAAKYNRHGGRLSLSARDVSQTMVRISVADSGEGIAQNLQSKLFEPFNRLGKEASDIAGTGIGLTVTKELVEAMGGYIGFESEPGKGSVFWFELPKAIS
ncbi:ATP-binding protein [Pseudomonadota bacterium]